LHPWTAIQARLRRALGAELGRALTICGDATTAVLGTVAWFVGLMAIFVPLALVRYRALR
jgi:hypothetical protein